MPIVRTGSSGPSPTRARREVPAHEEPTADAATTTTPSGPDRTPPDDRFVRPQMAVSLNDAALNTDLSGVVVNAAAAPKHTLDMAEILRAPEPRRHELTRRYREFLSVHAGGAVAATGSDLPPSGALARAGARAVIDGARVTLEVMGEARTLDTARPLRRSEADALLPHALATLERLLFTPTGVDKGAARLALFLVGPTGLLSRGGAPALEDDQRFRNPKLLTWDFNGTVEKFGDGRTRGGLPTSARALAQRGALSLITTTISPEKPEDFLVEAKVEFGGYYGKNEVRPTKGNKQYLGIAAAHGISPADAPGRMAVLGDSATDIPSDLPGVVFFHNSARTPAPAVELLLKAFDDEGAGHLARGLEQLLGGWPAPGDQRSLDLGDIRFSVEVRNSGTDADPVWVPTVHDVELTFDGATLGARLGEVPKPSDLAARARYHLALEHLVDGFDEARVADVLAGHPKNRSLVAVRAAVARRVDEREAELEAGREAAQGLVGWFTRPLPLDELAAGVASFVELGDPDVAAHLVDVVRQTRALADAAEPKVLEGLDTFAQALREKAQAALATALPFFPSKPKGQAAVRLERLAKSPITLHGKAQEVALELLDKVAAEPVPGSREALTQLLAGLDAALTAARAEVSGAFAERRAHASDLLALAQQAPGRAQARAQYLASMKQAVADTA